MICYGFPQAVSVMVQVRSLASININFLPLIPLIMNYLFSCFSFGFSLLLFQGIEKCRLILRCGFASERECHSFAIVDVGKSAESIFPQSEINNFCQFINLCCAK